jgi:8-oxo-dGTP diphosphatase
MLKSRSERDVPAPLLVVAAALVDDQNHVLVQQRPVGGRMAGLWEFPGGKIDPGETPEAALARELVEELGIQVGPLTPLAFASVTLGDRHLLLLLYICVKWSGTPRALHASEIRWVDPAQLFEMPMPEADVPLIPSIAAFVEQRRQ